MLLHAHNPVILIQQKNVQRQQVHFSQILVVDTGWSSLKI